jgi:hypothetical protein
MLAWVCSWPQRTFVKGKRSSGPDLKLTFDPADGDGSAG